MARKIVITSGKGGVGKTSITVGIGMMLAKKGWRVLMVDSDIGLNNLDVVLGVENRVVYDMTDLLAGRCLVDQAILKDTYINNLFILPSNHVSSTEDIKSQQFRSLILDLDKMFDCILIDSPAGIEKGFFRAISVADEAIVVTTPHVSAIRDADKVISILNSYKIYNVGLVVNRVRGEMVAKGSMLSGRQVSKILKKPLLGVCPEDDVIGIYSQLGRLDVEESKVKESLVMIAAAIKDGEHKIYDPQKSYTNLWTRFINFCKG